MLALLVRATWVQAYEGQALADDEHNRRKIIAQYAQPLGDIIVAGSPVTGSKRTEGSDLAYKRTYTDGSLYAAVTGYSSQAYGATQLEGIYSDVLDGTDSRLKNPVDALTGKQQEPGDVLTTIDPAVQKAGYEALGDTKGAAVAIDPKTGKILGMVSTPSYDPSKISGTTDGDAWKKLLADAGQAAGQPGAAAAAAARLDLQAGGRGGGAGGRSLRLGGHEDDSPIPYTLPGTTTVLENENTSAPCENATHPHRAPVLLQQRLREDGRRPRPGQGAGDGGEVRLQRRDAGLPGAGLASVYPTGMDKAQTALRGIGQFDVTATPLQMAMVSAAIANDGVLARRTWSSKVVGRGRQHASVVRGRDIAADRLLVDRRAVAQRDGDRGGRRHRDQRQGRRRRGRRQDGHRPARREQQQDAVRLVHLVRRRTSDGGKEVAVAVLIEDSGAARSEVSGNGLAAPIAQKMMAAALKS